VTVWLVRWEIDIETEDAVSAAKEAFDIQRDPNSIATVFDVIDEGTGVMTRVDLMDTGRGKTK